MRSSSFWSFLAILALAVTARAEDTYTFKLKHAPDVGKTITVTSTDTQTTSNKVTDPDGKVVGDDKKHTETTETVYTETVVEKGDARPNKYKRTYEKAKRKRDGKTEARSYEGRTLVFEKNKEGKYTVMPEGDKPIGPEDLEELTRKSNESDPIQGEVFLPSKAVKVGNTWKIDGKKLAEAFPSGVDAEQSSGEAKLTKVYQKDGHRFGVLDLTLKMAFPTPKGVAFEKPPVVTIKLTIDTAIDGSSTARVMTGTGKLASTGTAEEMGKKFTIESSYDLSGKKVWSAEK